MVANTKPVPWNDIKRRYEAGEAYALELLCSTPGPGGMNKSEHGARISLKEAQAVADDWNKS